MKFKSTVECCVGVRCPEETARYVDQIVKGLHKDSAFEYRRKALVAKTDFTDGERSDISLVSTEDRDRQNEKVVASGMELEHYKKNAIVLYDHCYDKPIGKCLWIKPQGNGLIAKTLYASRPAAHEGEWLPDTVYALVQQGVLLGKSIGFLPLEVRKPDREELSVDKSLEVVIEKALLLEYSCVTVPCCPTALVQAVNKGMKLPFEIKSVGKIVKVKKPKIDTDMLYAQALNQITFDPDEIARLALNRVRGKM